MHTNKPIAPKGETCPFNGKDTSKVCHKCPLYVLLRGNDPSTGKEVDHWGCSFTFLPMLLVENSQQQRATGAAVESFRNESVQRMDVANDLAATGNNLTASKNAVDINNQLAALQKLSSRINDEQTEFEEIKRIDHK